MNLRYYKPTGATVMGLVAGCGGGDKDKGINSTKDRPKAADKGQP